MHLDLFDFMLHMNLQTSADQFPVQFANAKDLIEYGVKYIYIWRINHQEILIL